MFFFMNVVQADTVTCNDKKYFSDNGCQVCQNWGEAETTTTSIAIPKQDLLWENTLEGINQNFYETSQTAPEIKTNIGIPPIVWDQKGLTWGVSVVWKDLDGLNIFSLDAGANITIKSIDLTTVSLTQIKPVTEPYFMLKIPISYYELKMGTFKESAKKTINYCIAYTPKKSALLNTATTPENKTVTTTNIPKNNDSWTPSSITTNTNSMGDPDITIPPQNKTVTTTNVSRSNDSWAPSASITTETSIDADIPSYTPKHENIRFNSAGEDTAVAGATRVPTGPAENIIILATILLSVLIFPKLNHFLFQK